MQRVSPIPNIRKMPFWVLAALAALCTEVAWACRHMVPSLSGLIAAWRTLRHGDPGQQLRVLFAMVVALVAVFAWWRATEVAGMSMRIIRIRCWSGLRMPHVAPESPIRGPPNRPTMKFPQRIFRRNPSHFRG